MSPHIYDPDGNRPTAGSLRYRLMYPLVWITIILASPILLLIVIIGSIVECIRWLRT